MKNKNKWIRIVELNSNISVHCWLLYTFYVAYNFNADTLMDWRAVTVGVSSFIIINKRKTSYIINYYFVRNKKGSKWRTIS